MCISKVLKKLNMRVIMLLLTMAVTRKEVTKLRIKQA